MKAQVLMKLYIPFFAGDNRLIFFVRRQLLELYSNSVQARGISDGHGGWSYSRSAASAGYTTVQGARKYI